MSRILVCLVLALTLPTSVLHADDKPGAGSGKGTGGGANAGDTGSRGVRSFGAVGDGVADDTAAIRRALAAGVGDVRLNKGTYRITETIVVDLDKIGYTS